MSVAPADTIIKDEDIIVKGGEGKIDDFNKFGFHEDLLNGIYGMDYIEPSKIQSFAIPILLKGKDLVMQSQSGSGKTMAFLLSSLQRINRDDPFCQVVILLNTRELARQTAEVFDSLTEMMDDATRLLCLPGYEGSIKSQFLIGTPSSVHRNMIKGMQQNTFDPKKVKFLIIDEADAILNEANQSNTGDLSVYQYACKIKELLSKDIQTVLVSATYPQHMFKLENKFVKENCAHILISQNEVPPTIAQLYLSVDPREKSRLIYEIFIHITKTLTDKAVTKKASSKLRDIGQVVVFANRKEDALNLLKYLGERNIPTAVLMSGDNNIRDEVIDGFRDFKFRFLITTDVMARGIDILSVNFVINYDLPLKYPTNDFDITTYIHRIGRTGRIGLSGLALSFVEKNQEQQFIQTTEKNNLAVDEFAEELLDQIVPMIEANEEKNKKLRERFEQETTN